jgi:hypothetical protein
MELMRKPVRIPDIDEFPSMRAIAVKIADAYLSLDFEQGFAILARDVIYRSDIFGVEMVGNKAVCAHFRKKAVKLRRENKMVFAIPSVLSDRIRPWKSLPGNSQGIYRYHHGEPVVKLGYDDHGLDAAILRFTLDSEGLVETLILDVNEFAEEDLENYLNKSQDAYFNTSIRKVTRELMNDGHTIMGMDRTSIIEIVSIKNHREYYTFTSITRIPYTPVHRKRDIDRFRAYCLECNAVGQLARVQLRMDNEYPWRIQLNPELVVDLEFEILD